MDTRDLDEAEQTVGPLLSGHRIVLRDEEHSFRARVRRLGLANVTIAHFQYGADIAVDSEPLDCYAVAMVLSGELEVRRPGAGLIARQGEAIAFSPGNQSLMKWSKDYEMLGVAVPASSLHDHGHHLFELNEEPFVFEPLIPGNAGHLFRSLVASTLTLTSGGVQDLAHTVQWQLRDSLLMAMLTELRHDRTDKLYLASPTRSGKIVRDAVAIMRKSLSYPPSVLDVAHSVGISTRHLRAAFRQELGVGPTTHLKRLRLAAVREELIRRSGKSTSVTQIATDVGGFYHLGRFSQEYLQFFGEYPSQTLHRARS